MILWITTITIELQMIEYEYLENVVYDENHKTISQKSIMKVYENNL